MDPLVDQLPSRFVVGVDLGTTNSAVAYVDTEEPRWQVRVFRLPQFVAAGELESLESLASFHFQPVEGQYAPGALRLPWQREASGYVVGEMARLEGAKTSGRLIASAKSWLCHTGVNRTADLLPWHGAQDVERLSPVEVSARFLRHIRSAWDAKFPKSPLAEQDLVLTLPASFDEVARELTIEAATRAGLPRVVLIEEPQAAFYAWVDRHAHDWEQQVTPGQQILVCDIGGGTTDFTLIRVRRSDGNADELARPGRDEAGMLAASPSADATPQTAHSLDASPLHAIANSATDSAVNFANKPANKPANKHANKPANEPANQPVNNLTNKLANDLANQPAKKSGTQSRTRGESTANSAIEKQAMNFIAAHNTNRSADQAGRIQFHRVAVGNHLILGGDNLDLALAQFLEGRLMPGGKLAARQWDLLVALSRRVKETLLGPQPPERWTVNLPTEGARLIRGGLQTEVTREDVLRVLVDGFLPFVPWDAKPQTRVSGFQEFGLPYAADPAITRYLAAFLTAHARLAMQWAERDQIQDHVEHRHRGQKRVPHGDQGDVQARDHSEVQRSLPDRNLKRNQAAVRDAGSASGHGVDSDELEPLMLRRYARPDLVLLNGGFFASPDLRSRLLEVLRSWFADISEPGWSPRVLENERLDLAVAQGAAYFGMVRRGFGVRITAALARSYYVVVGGEQPVAVCLVPGNAEPGQHFALPERVFQLAISEPVEFPLYVSSTRLADLPGQLLPLDREQMSPLPPIRTVLKARSRRETGTLPVTLQSHLTEIGTIELSCREVGGDRVWKLQFDVRSALETDREAVVTRGESQGVWEESSWEAAQAAIQDLFGPKGSTKPAELIKRLNAALGMQRDQWPMTLLRRIWEALLEQAEGRRRSEAHEARWLNLLGYALRPGYGLAVDDWRVAETWRTVRGKLIHGTPAIQNESLILWRRLAAGLTANQQQALVEPLLGPLRALHRRLSGGKAVSAPFPLNPEESPELWRLIGSLELLPGALKTELGNIVVDLLSKKRMEKVRPALIWALGRIGQRVPLHGPLNTVLPASQTTPWLHRLLDQATGQAEECLAVMQLARRTDDRYRDLDHADRELAVKWLVQQRAAEHLIQLVRDGGQLAAEEQGSVFGESLPQGLRLDLQSMPIPFARSSL